MPELPEVEIVARTLRPQIVGERIACVEILVPKLRYAIKDGLAEALQNTRITGVERLAKYLLCYLDNEQVLIVHLGMTGKFYVKQGRVDDSKHQRVIISLSGEKELIYADARKFGLIDLVPKQSLHSTRYFKNLGVDPLSSEFSEGYLRALCVRKPKMAIKQLLMDNGCVQGIGNIYANEILFCAGVSPLRAAGTLTEQEISGVLRYSREILKAAIEAGGSSIKDFVDGHGKSGGFQQQFKIYGRAQPCQSCKAEIVRIKQAGRSSFYCPVCQPLV